MHLQWSYFAFQLLIALNICAIKVVPADRQVIKKNGTTRTISRYYLFPQGDDRKGADLSQQGENIANFFKEFQSNQAIDDGQEFSKKSADRYKIYIKRKLKRRPTTVEGDIQTTRSAIYRIPTQIEETTYPSIVATSAGNIEEDILSEEPFEIAVGSSLDNTDELSSTTERRNAVLPSIQSDFQIDVGDDEENTERVRDLSLFSDATTIESLQDAEDIEIHDAIQSQDAIINTAKPTISKEIFDASLQSIINEGNTINQNALTSSDVNVLPVEINNESGIISEIDTNAGEDEEHINLLLALHNNPETYLSGQSSSSSDVDNLLTRSQSKEEVYGDAETSSTYRVTPYEYEELTSAKSREPNSDIIQFLTNNIPSPAELDFQIQEQPESKDEIVNADEFDPASVAGSLYNDYLEPSSIESQIVQPELDFSQIPISVIPIPYEESTQEDKDSLDKQSLGKSLLQTEWTQGSHLNEANSYLQSDKENDNRVVTSRINSNILGNQLQSEQQEPNQIITLKNSQNVLHDRNRKVRPKFTSIKVQTQKQIPGSPIIYYQQSVPDHTSWQSQGVVIEEIHPEAQYHSPSIDLNWQNQQQQHNEIHTSEPSRNILDNIDWQLLTRDPHIKEIMLEIIQKPSHLDVEVQKQQNNYIRLPSSSQNQQSIIEFIKNIHGHNNQNQITLPEHNQNLLYTLEILLTQNNDKTHSHNNLAPIPNTHLYAANNLKIVLYALERYRNTVYWNKPIANLHAIVSLIYETVSQTGISKGVIDIASYTKTNSVSERRKLTYIFNLMRQEWLQEILTQFYNTNYNINVIKHSKWASYLVAWRAPRLFNINHDYPEEYYKETDHNLQNDAIKLLAILTPYIKSSQYSVGAGSIEYYKYQANVLADIAVFLEERGYPEEVINKLIRTLYSVLNRHIQEHRSPCKLVVKCN